MSLPQFVVKFLLNYHKKRVWRRKAILKNFKKNSRKKPVILIERLSKHDGDLMILVEAEGLFIITKHCAPCLHSENEAGQPSVVVRIMTHNDSDKDKDLHELKDKATVHGTIYSYT